METPKLKKYSSFEELKKSHNTDEQASEETIKERQKQLEEFIKLLQQNKQ